MTLVDVPLGERSYTVSIAAGLLADAERHLAPYARDGRLVVVSDANVWAAQGDRLASAIVAGGLNPHPIILPAGEGSKSWATLGGLVDRLLALGVERGDHIVAFGGGVIGDLAGFAAAILKRGCSYVQIPTTLLAQVDSSVGGKTGINVAAGKNLVGAFHQPSAVLIDPDTLATLPEREIRAGYAEVVKYGLIGDADFFAWCEANGTALLSGDPDALLHAIETSVRAKAAIVTRDERENSGLRALLNLGHTFGHALEAQAGFGDRLLHGEAVALGMALAFRFSAEKGLCPAADAERVSAHLRASGLPVTLEEVGMTASGIALAGHMAHDKKRSGERETFILVRGIGQAFVDNGILMDDVVRFLDESA